MDRRQACGGSGAQRVDEPSEKLRGRIEGKQADRWGLVGPASKRLTSEELERMEGKQVGESTLQTAATGLPNSA